MSTINGKTRGECGYCGAVRTLRIDGTLPRHRADGGRSTTVPVCPGVNQTPEATVTATTPLDSNGQPVHVGDRVTPAGLTVGSAIVRGIAWDHPNDADRGVAWLSLDLVRDVPAGGSVVTGHVSRRSTRVTLAEWDGHTMAGLTEWRDDLVAKGSDRGLFSGLTGSMLYRAIVAECGNRRRAAERACLVPLAGRPLLPGTMLRDRCGCLIRATTEILKYTGPNDQHANDPSLYVRGEYVELCAERHHPSVRYANEAATRDRYRFFLYTMVVVPANDEPADMSDVERIISVVNAGRTTVTGSTRTDTDPVFPVTWERYGAAVRAGDPKVIIGARRLVVADVESSRPADRSERATSVAQIESAMVRLDLCWCELDAAIRAGREGDFDMLRDNATEAIRHSLMMLGR